MIINIIEDRTLQANLSLNKAKETLLLERIQSKGLLPTIERITKVSTCDGEIYYYDYNTEEAQFLIYFKDITSTIDRDNFSVNISIEYF